jgi:hypothetical protein
MGASNYLSLRGQYVKPAHGIDWRNANGLEGFGSGVDVNPSYALRLIELLVVTDFSPTKRAASVVKHGGFVTFLKRCGVVARSTGATLAL